MYNTVEEKNHGTVLKNISAVEPKCNQQNINKEETSA